MFIYGCHPYSRSGAPEEVEKMESLPSTPFNEIINEIKRIYYTISRKPEAMKAIQEAAEELGIMEYLKRNKINMVPYWDEEDGVARLKVPIYDSEIYELKKYLGVGSITAYLEAPYRCDESVEEIEEEEENERLKKFLEEAAKKYQVCKKNGYYDIVMWKKGDVALTITITP